MRIFSTLKFLATHGIDGARNQSSKDAKNLFRRMTTQRGKAGTTGVPRSTASAHSTPMQPVSTNAEEPLRNFAERFKHSTFTDDTKSQGHLEERVRAALANQEALRNKESAPGQSRILDMQKEIADMQAKKAEADAKQQEALASLKAARDKHLQYR